MCGSFLPSFSEIPVCELCWAEITPHRANCCIQCGEDLFQPAAANAFGTARCRACRLVPPAFEQAVSFGVYEGSMRALIHAFKYDRMEAASTQLGKRLAVAIEQLASADGSLTEMLVVPVPLHGGRMSERGFNQARALAAEALKALRGTHPEWKLELAPHLLVRQRITESQAGLTPRQRRLNLRGAFSVSEPGSIRARNILLIDDIYTTGATARVTSKVLIEAGAASVRVATLARAQRRVPMGPREKRNYLHIAAEVDANRQPVRSIAIH